MNRLRIGLFDMKDRELFTVRCGNSSCWAGMAWTLVSDLLRLTNISAEFLNGDELLGEGENPFSGCVELLRRDKLDLCPLLTTYSEDRAVHGNYLAPYVQEYHIQGFVLKVVDKDSNIWSVFRTFEAAVWVVVLVAVLAVAGCCVVMQRAGVGEKRSGEFGRYLLSVWADLIGQGRSGDNCMEIDRFQFFNGFSDNPLLILWSFSALLIAAFFNSSIYSITSIIPEYTHPFHDLNSMQKMGFKFVYRNSVIADTLDLLNISESPKINQLRVPGFNRSAFSELTDKPGELHHSNWSKSFFIESTEWKVSRSCEFVRTSINVRVKNDYFAKFPDKFFFSFGSFVITKRLPFEQAQLENAIQVLFETGNVQALQKHFFRSLTISDHVRKLCSKKLLARFITLPYGKYYSTFYQNESIFWLWFLGVCNGCLVFFVEALWIGKTCERLDLELQKRQQLGANIADLLRKTEDSNIVQEFDQLFEKHRVDYVGGLN